MGSTAPSQSSASKPGDPNTHVFTRVAPSAEAENEEENAAMADLDREISQASNSGNSGGGGTSAEGKTNSNGHTTIAVQPVNGTDLVSADTDEKEFYRCCICDPCSCVGPDSVPCTCGSERACCMRMSRSRLECLCCTRHGVHLRAASQYNLLGFFVCPSLVLLLILFVLFLVIGLLARR